MQLCKENHRLGTCEKRAWIRLRVCINADTGKWEILKTRTCTSNDLGTKNYI